MVSWIYSEPYILKFWTGVTITGQSGQTAGKMGIASRIKNNPPECVSHHERHFIFGFAKILRVKKKFEHFENRR